MKVLRLVLAGWFVQALLSRAAAEQGYPDQVVKQALATADLLIKEAGL